MKILLFLSKKVRNDIYEYESPNGKKFSGSLTNEAPVKYLCDKYKGSITEIICIVTKEAEDTAWDEFKDMVRHEISKEIKVIKIKYNLKKNFSNKPLNKILKHIEYNDKILFETTGGLRNDIMHLLLINRILFLKGIQSVEAVYSNFQTKAIEDVSHLITMFDLVGGVEELISMGNVRALRKYYLNQESEDDNMNYVLDCMESLIETITLCKTGVIEAKIIEFQDALKTAQNSKNPLLKQLLYIYQNKFGSHMDILDLVEWCVESGLYQQALTVYNEKVPMYIMRNFLIYDEKVLPELQIKSYEDPDTVLFTRGFLSIGNQDGMQGFKSYISQEDIKNKILNSDDTGIVKEYKIGISNIILCLNAMYKLGQYNSEWEKFLPENKKKLKEIMVIFKDCIPTGKDKMLNRITKMNKDGLEILLETKMVENYRNVFIKTIEGLELYIASSPFQLSCSVEMIQELSRDYLYIKNLRNMTNHASDENVTNKEMHRYFEEYNYINMEEITLKDIGEVLKEAVAKIRSAIPLQDNLTLEVNQKMTEIQSAILKSNKTVEEVLTFLLEK